MLHSKPWAKLGRKGKHPRSLGWTDQQQDAIYRILREHPKSQNDIVKQTSHYWPRVYRGTPESVRAYLRTPEGKEAERSREAFVRRMNGRLERSSVHNVIRLLRKNKIMGPQGYSIDGSRRGELLRPYLDSWAQIFDEQATSQLAWEFLHTPIVVDGKPKSSFVVYCCELLEKQGNYDVALWLLLRARARVMRLDADVMAEKIIERANSFEEPPSEVAASS